MSARRAATTALLAGALMLACGSESSVTTAVDGGHAAGGSPAGGASSGGSGARGATQGAGGGGNSGGTAGAGANTSTGGGVPGNGGTSLDAGQNQDSGAIVLVECNQDSSTISFVADPAVRRRVRGANGDFVDRCDSGGSLVKFACEALLHCGPGPNPACTSSYTGLVRPSLIDCAGQCQNGACDTRCPAPGQTIVYESTDGAGYFEARNETDGERYQCTVIFDNDRDSFDCIGDPKVGDRARIDASSNGTCEALFPLAVVVNGTDAAPGAAQCTLSCRRKSGDLAPAPGSVPPATACPSAGQTATIAMVGSPAVGSRITGTNGQYQDRCTTDGNLVDYTCAVTNQSTGPPWHLYSGQVAAQYYDCGRTCVAGACIASCPKAGQALAFESAVVEGYVTVRNVAEARRYGCAVTWDDPSDAFDCTVGVHSGTTGSIVNYTGSSGECTAQLAELPVTIDGATSSCPGCPQCKLDCRVTP